MPNSQKNIYTIVQNHDFLNSLAKGILNLAGNDYSKLTDIDIYLPNKRSINQLKLEFIKLSRNNACILPKIRSIGYEDEFNLNLNLLKYEGEPLDIKKEIPHYTRVFELARSIKQFNSDSGLSFEDITYAQSLKLAFSLIELIDDCDKFEIDHLEGLKAIFAEELSAHKQISIEFLTHIFSTYLTNIADVGLNPVKRRNIITNILSDIYNKHKPQNMVIIAGSTGTLPATRNLIKSISQLDNGYVVLPYIDLAASQEEWEHIGKLDKELSHQIAIKNLLENLKTKREDVKYFYDNNLNKADFSEIAGRVMLPNIFCERWRTNKLNEDKINKISIAELNSISQEATLISILAKQAYTENKKCGIITENKKLIKYISKIIKNFNIFVDNSLGSNYTATEEGKFILNIAQLISSGFNTSTFIELLKSPHIEHESSIETLEFKRLVNDIEINFARKYNLKKLDQLIHKLSSAPNNDENYTKNHLDFLNIYISKLSNKSKVSNKILIDSFKDIYSHLTGNEIDNCNEEFLDILSSIEKGTLFHEISPENLYDILYCTLNRIIVHPANIHNNKISILAPVEARLLHFDRIILADMNLGSFPKKRFSEWVNNRMKKDIGLPPEELDLSLNAHDFSSFIQFDEVFITRSIYDDSEPTSPSPFLTRLKSFLKSQDYKFNIDEEYINILGLLDNQGHEQKYFTKPEPSPPADSRERKISATFLEKTIKNPYGYYAKEILKLKKLNDLEEPSERREYGQFVHSSIEEFANYHKLDNEKIKISELNRIFSKNYEEAKQSCIAEPIWIFETTQFSPWFCKNEQERAANSSTFISEEKGVCEIHGIILSAIADRIEITEDNLINIVDFKTGRTPTEADVKNLISPQLLLEMVIAKHNGFPNKKLTDIKDKKFGSVIYYSLSLSSGGPSIQEIQVVEKDNLIELVENELKNFSESLLDENTPFLAYPDPKNIPEYDDYFHLARFEK